MRKVLLVVAFGLLAIGMGACGSPEEVTEETTETPITEISPTQPEETLEEQTGETETAQDPETGTFEEPLVAQQEETAARAGLIRSTNPEERLRQLRGTANGNGIPAAEAAPNQVVSDPFAVLPPLIVPQTPDPEAAAESLALTAREVPTIPEVPVAAVPPQWRVAATPTTPPPGTPTATATPGTIPALPTLPSPQRPPQAGTPAAPPATTTATAQPQPRPTTPTAQAPARPLPTPPSPPRIPDLTVAQVPTLPELPVSEALPQWRDPNAPLTPPPTAAAPTIILPPPPDTRIARAISVSGVMQVGDQARVILKAPTEPTSRYVNVGERIANGQVLVKRVKLNVAGDPIVIFEQNGVEIAVEVGTFEDMDEQLNLLQPSSPSLNTMTAS